MSAGLRMATAAVVVSLLGGSAFAEARQDRLNNLIALIMVEQSIEYCDFPITDAALGSLVDATGFYRDKLGLSDAELENLYAQSAEQFLERQNEFCNPRGDWRRVFDQTVEQLGQ